MTLILTIVRENEGGEPGGRDTHWFPLFLRLMGNLPTSVVRQTENNRGTPGAV